MSTTPETDALVTALEGKTDSFALSRMMRHADRLEVQRDAARLSAQSNSDALAKAVAELMEAKRELATAQARVSELEKEQEILLWNLAGCSTYAMGYDLTTGHNKEMARPALDDVLKLALRADEQRKRIAELEREVEYFKANNGYHRGHTDGHKEVQAALDAADKMNPSSSMEQVHLVLLARAYRQQAKENADKEKELRILYKDFADYVKTHEPLKQQLARYEGAEVLDEHTARTTHREWSDVRNVWLYPGDKVLVLRAEPNNLPAVPNGDALPSQADVGTAGSNSEQKKGGES